MRISRLSLLAYGHFTDTVFDLPARQPDILLVLGNNEAGKSTTLSAVEDLLFGIPNNTGYGFLHDYGNMRLGAVVNGTGGVLEFKRRKGTRDTLLNKEGLPLPSGEAALAPFLGGVDRSFYSRMFCLDHERLRDGGREILEARNDVGQILFSAGAGIAGLRELLKKLRTDADALWASRRASHRKYFQADDRLKAADNALRDHTVTAKQWQELRTLLDKANDAYQALEIVIEAKTADTRRLSRIRRVSRNVQRRAHISTRLEELKNVVFLPEDSAGVLDEALKDDSTAQVRLTTLSEQIDILRQQRSTLTYDEAFLARSDDIDQLHERRIQIRAGKADLPKRYAELESTEGNIKALAGELDWQLDDPAQIISRLPPRSKLAHARGLSQRRGELITAEENARAACAEASNRLSELMQEMAEEGPIIDVSGLAAIIKVAREAGDIDARIAAAEMDAQAITGSIQKLLMSMWPAVGEGTDLGSMPTPQKNVIEHYRDRSRQLAQHLEACRDQIRNTELILTRHRKEYDRTASEEHAVPPEELHRLRQHRDAGWAVIRRKYVEQVSVPNAEMDAFVTSGALPEAYEAAIQAADVAADQRYEKAEATARLAEIARQIAEQQEHLEQLHGQEAGYVDDEVALAAEWAAVWKGASLTPLSPDDMLGWIDGRSQVLLAMETKAAAERKLASLRDEESRQRNRLTTELATLDLKAEPLSARPLRVVVELAADVQRQHEAKANNRRRIEQELKKAKTDQSRKDANLQDAQNALKKWEVEWSAAMQVLNLNPDSVPEILDAQMETLGAMREGANKISDLRHERIEKIERDIDAFAHQVKDVIAFIAPHLADMEHENAVIELEKVLKDAKRARELAVDIDVKSSAEQKKIDACQEMRLSSKEVVDRLQKVAGVASVDELRNSIALSNELRSLQAELQKTVQALNDDGDGKSPAELVEECAAADLDQIAATEQTINQELKDLQERRIEASEARAAARRDFDAIGGDDRAARAASDRQAAIAEMRDIAEEYIRLRSAELLLESAVERYRREKQAPLLKRAGELFAILTGGSFRRLQVEFDESDKMQIVGVRQSGRKVSASGMTGGSVDQLYLALRVAAVEGFLSHSTPLPFIADDLFINFDEKRAAAGFKVLGELAQKTQVLFFTHHQHLIDIANATLGKSVSTIYLPEPIALRADPLVEQEAEAPIVEHAANG